MRRILLSLLCCATVVGSLGVANAVPVASVSPDEAKAWVRYTVPLPKSIEISSKSTYSKDAIEIVAPAGSDIVIGQACKELKETMGLPDKSTGSFKITLQLGGPESDNLKSLKNSDQAYNILPGSGGLRLVALKPAGLYYAAKTLQQLVKPYVTDGSVVVPVVKVTDWPDLMDRGTWGSDNYDVLRWFGDRKLNIVEQISGRSLDKDGTGHSSVKAGREPMITEAPLYAIKPVPVVLHLDQVSGCGMFDVFPNLKAKGGKVGAICYSQPQIVDILRDWIADLASLPNAAGVDVWLAENTHGQGGCTCDECKKVDRNVLEARVIFKAWEKAQEKIGRPIQLYILSSEETVKANAQIIAEMPKGCRFWYYQWLTYNTSESPMVKPELRKAAAEGKWIGVVPNLDSMTHFLNPFTGAEFIHYRMNEFVDTGMQGLLGYATPKHMYNPFNLEAAAEWSWNAKGRTPHEFTLSYAMRHGIKDPERWTQWADLVGPVEWDVYGSEWPSGAQRGIPDPVAKQLLEGKLPPLGTVLWDCFWIPWGDIKNVQQLDKDVADAAKALQIAKDMGTPEYWYESLVADGYIKSLKALYQLKGIVGKGKVAPADRDKAQQYFQMYFDSLKQVKEALPKWEEIKDPIKEHGGYTDKAGNMCEQLRKEMADTASKLGFDFKI